MQLKVKTSGGLPYVRKEPYEYERTQYEADIKNGDTIRILDSGEVEQGNFGEQTVFKVKTRNGDKKFTMNQSTINVLVQEFGEDTEGWIGKDVSVILQKKIIAGKKAIVAYLVTDSWKLDEYGELTKLNTLGVEARNTSKEEKISVDQIPF